MSLRRINYSQLLISKIKGFIMEHSRLNAEMFATVAILSDPIA